MRFRLGAVIVVAVSLAGWNAIRADSSSYGTGTFVSPSQNHVHSIVIMPHNPGELYMGGHYRLYQSTDGGVKWKPLIKQMMLSMTLDPTHPSTLYGVSQQSGLQKSIDAGAHWKSTQGNIPRGQVVGVVFDRTTKAVIAFGTGIYRSTNGGKTWTAVLEHKSVSAVTVGASGSLYAASDNGLYASHDNGQQWASVASVGNQPILQVVASGKVGYAVSPLGILKTSDNGHTWNLLDKAPSGIDFLGISPSNANEIFGEISQHGLVMSHDGGATWQQANNGIHDTNFTASTIQVAPSSPAIVYTGSWGIHFYASHDGGRHWTRTSTLLK